MKANIKKFVRERNEMLKKCNVTELRKFINKYKDTYGAEFVARINAAPDPILEITLHKMIVNVPKLPKALREKSAVWLLMRGYDLNT
jgi:hypothetical protein